MRLSHFLVFCTVGYSLWLVHNITTYGILNKEREATNQLFTKSYEVLNQIQASVDQFNKISHEVKAYYLEKVKNAPKTMQAWHSLLYTLQYSAIIFTCMCILGIGKYLLMR